VRGNTSGYGIWAMNVNGTSLRQLTDVPSDALLLRELYIPIA
jgi:hypothetical protein